MGISVSLILIAIGAILTWAVTADVSGVDLQTVGVILMVVGAVGGLISLAFWSSWGGFGGPAIQSCATVSWSVDQPLHRDARRRREAPPGVKDDMHALYELEPGKGRPW